MLIKEKDIKSIISQLNNLNLTDGMWVFHDFREKLKNIFWIKNVVLTNNWTSALYLAYKSVWLNKDDEVITWVYTYHSTNSTILNFTKNIIFCDYDNNISICIKDIENKISNKTKLLVIPHTWWLCTDMNKIIELKNKYKKLFIIEDCSQAHFAKYYWRYLWTFWDIWVFSMQWWKLLTSWEWWFAITNSDELYEKMVLNSDSWKTIENLLKNDKYKEYIDTWLGLMKFRPNPIWIAFANSQLDNIFSKLKVREYISNMIKKETENIKFIKFPEIEKLEQSYYELVSIYDKNLNNNIEIEDFLNILRNNNISEIYNPKNNKPNHLCKLFKDILWKISFKNSEFIYSNLLIFKISDNTKDIKEIVKYIKKFKHICKM